MSTASRSCKFDLLAWAGLAIAALAILWPLGLTNRIMAGVDALTYFTPYWAHRMAELRSGHLPLWNPYLFLGVPFLANLQAAVLYPLHWPFTWLPPSTALIWSALLHAWLAAGFTYTFGRRSLRLSRPAAWLTGLLFGLSGLPLARAENINQLNTLAWLPALLWLYDETAGARDWKRKVRWATGLAVVVALQLLAGHTQIAFVNLVGLGLYAVIPLPTARRLAPLIAVLPGTCLAAAQLLPTAELSGLGWRTGGLTYRQAVSFSLQPQLLAQTLLPPFGGGLAKAFASEGFTEFVAYIGVIGVILAGLGVASIRQYLPLSSSGFPRFGTRLSALQRDPHLAPASRLVVLIFAGLFLALGAYNPVYYLLWRFAPGFDLFRAPVRWLELLAFGMAGLAGLGLDAWLTGRLDQARQGKKATPRQGPWFRISLPRSIALTLGTVALIGLLALQHWPPWPTVLGWALMASATAVVLCIGRRWRRQALALLLALAIAELWLGGRALPFALATAPGALSLRNAPAALLAGTTGEAPGARGRILSMSDIRFDPGDLDELRSLQADNLPAEAVDRLVRASKQMEVVAPNLSLLLELPTVDGYDGGLLPTDDYARLLTLFVPPAARLPDGRLREQVREVPEDRLLDLTGVRFIVTDKQNDLWANDVYYDLEQAATLGAGQALSLDLADYPPFSATRLGIVSHLADAVPDGMPVADIVVTDLEGQSHSVTLHAGTDTDWGAEVNEQARIARAWPDWMGQRGYDFLALVDLPEPVTPQAITIRVPSGVPAAFVLQGLSLMDTRTGAHFSITVSPRGDRRRIYSGDVKIFERLGAPGRAWLVHGLQPVLDETEALARLSEPLFDPRRTALVIGPGISRPPESATPTEEVTIRAYNAERVSLYARAVKPATLVLADAFYPGWKATVDGVPAEILKVNFMFRGLHLEPGEHEVTFLYQPETWWWGLRISLCTALALACALLVTWLPAFPGAGRSTHDVV
jgi:hypothetical protein